MAQHESGSGPGDAAASLFERVLARARELGASDLHVEPTPGGGRVRMRLRGALREVMALDAGELTGLVNNLAAMAALDPVHDPLPADGRLTLPPELGGNQLRITLLPCTRGLVAAVRLLPDEKVGWDLAMQGFAVADLEVLRDLLRQRHGLVLVGGPAGAGKTSLLYALMRELVSPERQLVSIEDPVMADLLGVNQVQVDPARGVTFAAAIRGFLRADPDCIAVEKLWDAETARAALEAALTAHLVLATLHCTDAAAAIGRLLEMGIQPYLVAAALLGVVVQRQVRRVCADCREPYLISRDYLQSLGIPCATDSVSVFRARREGCETCRHRGYHGQTGIHEVLPMTPELAALVLRRAEVPALRAHARASGVASLYHDGFLKVMEGSTTIDEVLRATRQD